MARKGNTGGAARTSGRAPAGDAGSGVRLRGGLEVPRSPAGARWESLRRAAECAAPSAAVSGWPAAGKAKSVTAPDVAAARRVAVAPVVLGTWPTAATAPVAIGRRSEQRPGRIA
jgi:hypothetical protein